MPVKQQNTNSKLGTHVTDYKNTAVLFAPTEDKKNLPDLTGYWPLNCLCSF
jgi:hypothetical protein